MIGLTLTDIQKYCEEPCYLRALCHVSPERRKKAENYRFAKDRALSLGASVLLDDALIAYGLRERDMTYETEANKKPCFPEHFPFHFSISHSGTVAALAVSDRPVGCDVQIVRDADLKMAGRFFAPQEAAYVKGSADPSEQAKRFVRVWALKESFAKALGEGLGLPLSSYSVLDEKNRAVCPASFEIPYAFYEYEIPGYALSVCAPKGERPDLVIR